MRHTEFWTRMNHALGDTYAKTWAELTVLAELDGRTVSQALSEGMRPKEVWLAVWRELRLPERER